MKKGLLAFAVLALVAAPVLQAQAGLIFLPWGLGVFFLVYGIVINHMGLVILDGTAGQTQMEKSFNTAYPFIENPAVVSDLATTVLTKLEAAKAGEDGMIRVSLTEEEVRNVLAPAALEESQIETVVNDLK